MSTELARNVAHAGLRAPATSGATSVSVELITGAWPTVPFTALLEDGTSRKEQVSVTGVSGNTLTVTRAQGGTSAVAHDTMSSVDVITTNDDLATLETLLGAPSVATHEADTTAVHGITDTSALALTSALTAHDIDTTSVHGITDTSALATTSGVTSAVSTHAGLADPHTGYVLESLYDAKGDLLAASADNTPAKVTAGANNTVLVADSAQTAGVKWAARPTAVVRRTAGDLSLSSNGVWGNVNTGLDLTLAAVVGDKIEYGISGLWNDESVNALLDVATWVSGAAVTYFGSGSGTQTTNGVTGWFGLSAVASVVSGAAAPLTLVSGDISGGNVVLRLLVKTSSATAKTLFASTDNALVVYAKNLGPG